MTAVEPSAAPPPAGPPPAPGGAAGALGATGPPKRPARARLIKPLRRVLGLGALVFVVLAVAGRWSEVRAEIGKVDPWAVAGAGALAVASLYLSMLSWRALLADLGSPLPPRRAARVLFLGQLGKYIPAGTVWAVLAQTELARDLGVPRRRSTAAGFVYNGLSLAVALLLGTLSLPVLLSGGTDVPDWAPWAVVLSPLALACLGPRVLTWLVNTGLRVLRRAPLERPFSRGGVLRAVGWMVGSWLLLGAQIYLLGADLGAEPAAFVVPALGGYAVAWACGFLSVVAPSGAGVRELLLTATLAAHLPGGAAAALTIAVISRVVMTLADLLAALTAYLLGRRLNP